MTKEYEYIILTDTTDQQYRLTEYLNAGYAIYKATATMGAIHYVLVRSTPEPTKPRVEDLGTELPDDIRPTPIAGDGWHDLNGAPF